MSINNEVQFVCPRCEKSVAKRFYGPSGVCRKELRLTLATNVSPIESEPFSPKVNVSPNSVALKE